MRNRIEHLHRDERGMSLVLLGAGIVAFMAAATLAIDVGMFMNARAQAQNAADAGALAGVTGLVNNSFTDRSTTGPAVQGAMNAAKSNKVIGIAPTVLPADVTFPVSPSGASNRVQVDVHRAGDNSVATLIGTLLGVASVDVHATATAEASPANAMTCVKPFMIPDKWKEIGTPPWDPSDSFDVYDNHGIPLPNPDVYVPAANCKGTAADCPPNADYTGYSVAKDKGTSLVLRAGTGDQINPSFYFSWKMPGDVGGDFYRENIANCNTSLMEWYDEIVQEPGDKSGPTIQGIEALIAKDPTATWEPAAGGGCNCVKSTYQGQSPRVFPIPLYDPKYYADGKANGRPADFRIANFLGFFADHVSGNKIYGYITNITGIVAPTSTDAPTTLFPLAIRLVK